jgi:hypothetical protein
MRKEQNKFAVVQAQVQERRRQLILEAFKELSLESRNAWSESAFHLQEAMSERRNKSDFGTTAAHELLGALVIYRWKERGRA